MGVRSILAEIGVTVALSVFVVALVLAGASETVVLVAAACAIGVVAILERRGVLDAPDGYWLPELQASLGEEPAETDPADASSGGTYLRRCSECDRPISTEANRCEDCSTVGRWRK